MRSISLAGAVIVIVGLAAPLRAQKVLASRDGADSGWVQGGNGLRWKFGTTGWHDAESIPSVPLLLRFQLIKASPTRTTEPALAGLDSALRDLFRFPGYKLMSSAAISADYSPPGPGDRNSMPTFTEQLLTSEGITYHLQVAVDTATSQMVRLDVSLYRPLTSVATNLPGGGVSHSSDRETLLHTTVTISYGRTVVLGSTQPAGLSATDGLAQTLILTVKPESR